MSHRERTPTRARTLAYIGPFAVYIALMAVERWSGLSASIAYPLRALATFAAMMAWSRPLISLKPSRLAASALLGAAVFLIWIGPDVLFQYRDRHHWVFNNRLVGSPDAPSSFHADPFLILCHFAGSALIVPIVEELFWRGWMMRWLIRPDFEQVRLGEYSPLSFWLVAVLFAAEHGSYWEVGLAAGVIYNWWMMRTRSLADCIFAHAVTNAILASYVVVAGQWQYWP